MILFSRDILLLFDNNSNKKNIIPILTTPSLPPLKLISLATLYRQLHHTLHLLYIKRKLHFHIQSSSSWQQLSGVLLGHGVPEVQPLLLWINAHRQLIRNVQVGNVQLVCGHIPWHWRPQHCNVIIITGTDCGGAAGVKEEKQSLDVT